MKKWSKPHLITISKDELEKTILAKACSNFTFICPSVNR